MNDLHATANSLTPRGQARRQRLLCAARDVFLEKGYSGASVSDIVARAGGSLSTLYKQFGNKEGLFIAALEAHASTVWARLEQSHQKPPEEVLYELAQGLIDLVISVPQIRLIRGINAEAERTPELGQMFLERGPDRTRRELAEYLRTQHDAGILQVDNPKEAAGMFTGMVAGEWLIDGLAGRFPELTDELRDQRARNCTAIFLAGLRRRD